jgi:hypothetical protein
MLLSNVFSFCHEFCRRQICKYSGRTTQNGFDLHYFIPSYAIANRGSTWGIIPTILLSYSDWGRRIRPEEPPCGFNIIQFITNHSWLNCHRFYGIESDNLEWNILEHTNNNTCFPLFVLLMIPAVLEWEKFYVFQQKRTTTISWFFW